MFLLFCVVLVGCFCWGLLLLGFFLGGAGGLGEWHGGRGGLKAPVDAFPAITVLKLIVTSGL